MAGTFTHWMVVEEFFYRFNKLTNMHKYFPVIKGNNHFVILGACGPDYPYLSEIEGNILKIHSWADRMHYENANMFIKHGIDHLLKLNNNDFNVCLSWLCGYLMHIIADAVIHPVVNAIVGPYIFNADNHRYCEMIQDSFIFHHIKGYDIKYADYLFLIRMCSDREDDDLINPAIRDFWSKTLRVNHPQAKDNFDKIDPDDWHASFVSKINLAADTPVIFRHVGKALKMSYKKISEISKQEMDKFINMIKLPGNRIGNFKEDAFDRAVDKVIEILQKIFIDIENKSSDNCLSYIKNWNLDTGVDEDQIYFWK